MNNAGIRNPNPKNLAGYRLFVHVFSLFWQGASMKAKKNLLEIFGGRWFLGVAAKVWQQYNIMEKSRWSEMAAERSSKVFHYTDGQLVAEITEKVGEIIVDLH